MRAFLMRRARLAAYWLALRVLDPLEGWARAFVRWFAGSRFSASLWLTLYAIFTGLIALGIVLLVT